MRSPLRPEFRFTPGHSILAFAIFAVMGGFAFGAFVAGPVFSDETSAEEPDARRAARFASRTTDLATIQPDPFPYRTPTPDFGMAGSPNYGAIARQNAQQTVTRQHRGPGVASREARDAFAFEPPEARAPAPSVRFDRHTGVAY